MNGHRSDASCKPDLPLSRHLRSTGHHDSFGKLKVTIIDHKPKWDDKSRQEKESFWIKKLKTLSRNGINEKSYILSWPLFLLVSSSRIKTCSLLNWPKAYIPHCGGPFIEWVWVPFSKIFLTVLFDALANNVSFLFLILHLFKCVALLCIYIIVIVLWLIYMWDFNYFMYVFSYD